MQHEPIRKLAFVFSGQGAQHPGMGKELYETDPAARAVFDRLEALRPGTINSCFYGSAEELQETEVTQPCLFATELAIAAAVEARGLIPDAVAGFSLGELSAVCFAGILPPERCFPLVCLRAREMARCAAQHPGGMLAVLRLNTQQVEEICAGLENAWPVNYNCPGQTVCAAARESLPVLEEAVKAAGGRCLPLKVSGPFHSPYMNGAAEALTAALQAETPQPPRMPVYANLTARPYEDARATLPPQCCSPVRWEESIREMAKEGICDFVEIGPGKVLAGLIKKIDGSLRVFSVEDPAGLDRLMEEIPHA